VFKFSRLFHNEVARKFNNAPLPKSLFIRLVVAKRRLDSYVRGTARFMTACWH